MVANTDAGASYSNPVGFIYIFNLIVGAGALALPIGFSDAGLILGVIFLAIVAFLAFVTVTWINEVQAVGNATLYLKRYETTINGDDSGEIQEGLLQSDPEDRREGNMTPGPTTLFDIKQRIEFGHLAEIFLGPIGQKVFYAILVVYLYGDLSIYAVAIPTSLQAVTGGWWKFSSNDVYYIYLTAFAVCIIPLSFFNFQKTKYLQLLTVGTRNIALFMMIILACIFIGEGNGSKASQLRWFDITGLPSMFGVSIYAFMCHHSLPSLVTPIRDKSRLTAVLGSDFMLIFSVYSLLCVSALFAFGTIDHPVCEAHPGPACQIQRLYTLNFASYSIRPIAVFLTLFPLFTLSSNFPLISITLRNNLMTLVPWLSGYPKLRPIVFGLIATLPPIAVAFATKDVDLLVGITGSYAGLGIMFVMPAFLLFYAKKKAQHLAIKKGIIAKNPHESPFRHNMWILLVLGASVVCLGFATFNIIWRNVKH